MSTPCAVHTCPAAAQRWLHLACAEVIGSGAQKTRLGGRGMAPRTLLDTWSHFCSHVALVELGGVLVNEARFSLQGAQNIPGM